MRDFDLYTSDSDWCLFQGGWVMRIFMCFKNFHLNMFGNYGGAVSSSLSANQMYIVHIFASCNSSHGYLFSVSFSVYFLVNTIIDKNIKNDKYLP